MIDEQNQQVDETQVSASESSEPTSTPSEPASEAVETEVAATASESEDETDYEAAFMELRSNYAAKEREIEGLKKQADELNNQYMRIAADFENFRRRTQREKEELETQIKCSTVKELLPVVDNFERARSQIKPQTDGEANIHKSYQGVYKDMVDRLKKVGVAPMRAEGKEFDPNLHEAVMREPTSEHPEGTVIEELMRGYMLEDKVLRHAMVKVAAPPEDGDSAETEG
ncbi:MULTISPECIES: nucleotide exchange factor GrpE [Leptolyngbya]|jgi:molecular chaperone GrpE|uniref:Protein GrpE n=2 Tax=Leptolyngbya boryana TaxID=1184 RepID=A0A1Z4JKH1_LEPBY|nr:MULTISPECIES: nucleotide exchange factor GrpE [Leptolyngbya]BAY57252.1 GrpE protein [Leptolyngbya boryana NIES-2135]MBD1857398.1 nucleotide exchange factor GrpE [Leptolyngbya sp. FACHB-1624]MBD2366998.1 nucleotide exchange factor GrpE [Leptolyngbya sp. FACHB-161]MBD2373648.1 nucleotide exchange factor GrpE [Leptolyngbya sp. FACHB-238]MBD2398057.1 nucleotide exchange factor GrpE [Leptolyngbya sp. FACHB-239]